MLFLEIVVFYILKMLSAPWWCYLLDILAIVWTSFTIALKVSPFLVTEDEAE